MGLVELPLVGAVTFTGSTAAGRLVMRAAGERLYVELAHLVVEQAPPGDIGDGAGSTPGERAASQLRALDLAGREVAFSRLVDAANAVPTADRLRPTTSPTFTPSAKAAAESGVRASCHSSLATS